MAVNSLQQEQLLRWFFYHMPMEQREKLMRELPDAYNAYCGSEVVRVVRVRDGSPVPVTPKPGRQRKLYEDAAKEIIRDYLTGDRRYAVTRLLKNGSEGDVEYMAGWLVSLLGPDGERKFREVVGEVLAGVN